MFIAGVGTHGGGAGGPRLGVGGGGGGGGGGAEGVLPLGTGGGFGGALEEDDDIPGIRSCMNLGIVGACFID